MNSFKPGNWVRHIAFKSKHKCISINDGEFDDKVSVTNSPSFDNEFMIDYELWQPKVGEWCWFWNRDKPNKPKLKQLYSINYEHDVHWTYKTIDCKTYQHCEPFIGQLPTNLKDLS